MRLNAARGGNGGHFLAAFVHLSSRNLRAAVLAKVVSSRKVARRASANFAESRAARDFFLFRPLSPQVGAHFSKDLAVFRQQRGDFGSTTPQKSLALRGAAAENALSFPVKTLFLGREFCGLGREGAKDKIDSDRADRAFCPRDFTMLARPFCLFRASSLTGAERPAARSSPHNFARVPLPLGRPVSRIPMNFQRTRCGHSGAGSNHSALYTIVQLSATAKIEPPKPRACHRVGTQIPSAVA